jgi:hypothetical protein
MTSCPALTLSVSSGLLTGGIISVMRKKRKVPTVRQQYDRIYLCFNCHLITSDSMMQGLLFHKVLKGIPFFFHLMTVRHEYILNCFAMNESISLWPILHPSVIEIPLDHNNRQHDQHYDPGRYGY